MRYKLHPEAALEHEEQISYYEARSPGLGARYHAAFRQAAIKACEAPKTYPVIAEPRLRCVSLQGFPHQIIFRESEDAMEILAVAHVRRRPRYWAGRLLPNRQSSP